MKSLEQKLDLDEQMIRDQDSWPHWPRLPMKRRGADGQMELATLFPEGSAGVASHFPLFKVNLFEAIKPSNIPCLYPSAASLLNDGWRVD